MRHDKGLYRKYRPKSFKSIWGQESIVQTFQNMFTSGIINDLSAFLFIGTRGSGKTTTARIIAKAVNCLNIRDGNPCNECENCKLISESSTTDILEMDAASNRSVEDIERIVESVKYLPTTLKRKVVIIDEVHQLSYQAKDALLITLENCPPHVLFILATTEGHKVPKTVRSRCMLFEFRSATVDEVAGLLSKVLDNEKIDYDAKGLEYIGVLAKGSYRDALTIVEGIVIEFGNATLESVRTHLALPSKDVVLQTVHAIVDSDIEKCLSILDDIIKNGGIDVDSYLSEVTRVLLDGARTIIVNNRDIKGLKGHDLIEIGVTLAKRHKEFIDESPNVMGTLCFLNAVSQVNAFREKS